MTDIFDVCVTKFKNNKIAINKIVIVTLGTNDNQHYFTNQNATQHKETHYNYTLHNYTQHNDIHHKYNQHRYTHHN
jgi:hypothetical protein